MRTKTTNRNWLPRLATWMIALSLPVGCTAVPVLPQGTAQPPTQGTGTTAGTPPAPAAPSTTMPPAAPAATSAPATAKTQTADDAQLAAQVQRDMDDMDMIADNEAGFAAQALTVQAGAVRTAIRAELRAEARAAIKALSADRKQAIVARSRQLRQKTIARLQDVAAGFKQGMTRDVTDNDLGGKTVSTTFDIPLPNGAKRSGSTERIFNADQVLVSAKQVQDWTGPKGNTRHMERTKELQADGSYLVQGTATMTADGKTRSFTWTTTIAADGTLHGTGTLTRFNGTTVTISFSGTEDRETSTASDPATGTTATVDTSAETGSDTAATVTDPTTQTTTEVTISADADSTASDASGTDAAASASTDVSASGSV